MDNQRNKLDKFLKNFSQCKKHNIYRFVLNFVDELGDPDSYSIHGSVEIHAPCRTSDPFANIPSFSHP